MDIIPEFKKFAKKRGREVVKLLEAEWTPETAQIEVAGQQVQFRVDVERRAAWKLYVELNTRVTTQPLAEDQGGLREALSSVYAIFGITREILKEAGPAVGHGRESLGYFAMEVLNQVLRPFLTKWHPRLVEWEGHRVQGMSAIEHESTWEDAKALRAELVILRGVLLQYTDALAELAGLRGE